ncbi:UNVERIFIED_ORG: hypothetical protein J3D58_001188 [Paenarthrobacter nicotinovorans]
MPASTTKVRLAGWSMLVAALVLVTGCTATPGPPTAPTGSTAPGASSGASSPVDTGTSTPASAAGAPSNTVDPAVAATTTEVESTLKKLVAGNPKPDREALRAALASAGIPQQNIEVSVSRTPTGLDVDAMEAAALTGQSCVMGQIRDGGVVVTVLPVLSTGKCFIGDAR